MSEKVYTVEEVAEIMKSVPYTVRKLINAGKVHAFKFGGAWRITESELERIMNGGAE